MYICAYICACEYYENMRNKVGLLVIVLLWMGSFMVVSAQDVPAIHVPYSMGFEKGDSAKLALWHLNDNADTTVCKERWVIGMAVKSEGKHSLYISYDEGETCAFDTIGATYVRDVEPGEIVTITKDGISSVKDNVITESKRGRCIFEYIYFSREDSYIDNVSVYNARFKAGEFLAKDSYVDADLVVGVPNSGNTGAKGFAKKAKIPYADAFVKNSYIGRTFIQPEQSERTIAVKIKLNVLKEVVKDKRIVLIDDSIVRGTTSREIINLLREAGAKEIHMRISSPPFICPCFFGIDVPKKEELITYNHTKEEICKIIGADSLEYLRVERLPELVNKLKICRGCFTGKYPVKTNTR